MNTKTESIAIRGMSCGHCVKSVREALEDVQGVQVEDVQIGSAHVTYDPGQADHGKIVEAIEEAGFKVA